MNYTTRPGMDDPDDDSMRAQCVAKIKELKKEEKLLKAELAVRVSSLLCFDGSLLTQRAGPVVRPPRLCVAGDHGRGERRTRGPRRGGGPHGGRRDAGRWEGAGGRGACRGEGGGGEAGGG